MQASPCLLCLEVFHYGEGLPLLSIFFSVFAIDTSRRKSPGTYEGRSPRNPLRISASAEENPQGPMKAALTWNIPTPPCAICKICRICRLSKAVNAWVRNSFVNVFFNNFYNCDTESYGKSLFAVLSSVFLSFRVSIYVCVSAFMCVPQYLWVGRRSNGTEGYGARHFALERVLKVTGT